MEIAIDERLQQVATQLVTDGRYPSMTEVVSEGIRLVEERGAARIALRATIAEAEAEAGEGTIEQLDDMLQATFLELKHKAG